MSNTVTATFKTYQAAEQAINALEAEGFKSDQLSVLMADRADGKKFDLSKESMATEGAGVGAVTGGLIGAIVGSMATVAASIAIPGLGVMVAGPVFATLAGVGAGATAGGLIGTLVGLGIPEYEAKRYENEVKNGSVLIALDAESSERAKRARKILERQDAHNIAA